MTKRVDGGRTKHAGAWAHTPSHARADPATALVVGIIIGASIFVQPSEIMRDVPSVSGILLVWLLAGLLTAAGALICAELASAWPESGGVYMFLRRAGRPGARGARVYHSMAEDGLLFRWVAETHPRYRTSHRAIVLQAYGRAWWSPRARTVSSSRA